MSDTLASLRRKIGSAGDLQSVVRSMKALAAANIVQYEQSVRALEGYYRTVERGLSVCFRDIARTAGSASSSDPAVGKGEPSIDAVVFGSDQGLVGRFNDTVAEFALEAMAALPGSVRVWAVGERVHARLSDAGVRPAGIFIVPGSVDAIAALVGRILIESEPARSGVAVLHLFHNSPGADGSYAPVGRRLLPLDASWQRSLEDLAWPSANLPEVLGGARATLRALIREYLFVSLFRACAESLASENASRLAAMQRADRNIEDVLDEMNGTFHRLRQGGIDAELFEVVSGFEALVPQLRGA